MVDFKIIPGYENYLISEVGSVYNTKRQKFKAIRNSDRYLNVTLYRNGRPKIFNIHRLVAIAFVPNPDNKPEVNHIDGDTFNNHSSNLEWCTRSENALHGTQVLKKNRGENNSQSILTEEQVIKIKALLDAKELNQHQIGQLFGVSNHVIHKINAGKNWSWLGREGRNTSCEPL